MKFHRRRLLIGHGRNRFFIIASPIIHRSLRDDDFRVGIDGAVPVIVPHTDGISHDAEILTPSHSRDIAGQQIWNDELHRRISAFIRPRRHISRRRSRNHRIRRIVYCGGGLGKWRCHENHEFSFQMSDLFFLIGEID